MHSSPAYMLDLNTNDFFSKKNFEDVWLGFSTTEFNSIIKFFENFSKSSDLTKNYAYNSLEASLYSTTSVSKDLYTATIINDNKNLQFKSFSPVFSLSRLPGRNSYTTYKNIATVFTQQATLSEILTIREYLYQRLLYKKRT